MDLLQRMDGLRIINSVMVHILLLIKSCIVLPQFPNLYTELCADITRIANSWLIYSSASR